MAVDDAAGRAVTGNEEVESALDTAADLLARADALLVCAGAGMGVDSGLPDFRGDAGFWKAYPPYARLGLSFVDLADPVHFARDPELAWGFYGHRLGLYRSTTPHAGFAMLRRWGERMPRGLGVFTSNVDGQFQRAGMDLVAEVHGSIHHLQCAGQCRETVWPADGTKVEVDAATMRAGRPLPTCPRCGGLARPNILMFDDHAWIGGRSEAGLRALASWLRDLRKQRLAVIEIGAGTAVPTVRRQAEAVAGSSLIRINPAEPDVRPGGGVSVPMGALAALTTLDERLR